MTDVTGKVFLAAMTLYQKEDNTVEAHIRMQGADDVQVVDVPPHMAAMLPQAIAMISQQGNENNSD